VVSAPFPDFSLGGPSTAYLIDLMTGQIIRTINSPTPVSTSQFGFSVAISNDFIAIGAPFDDVPGVTDAGAVYVYDLRNGSVIKISNPDPHLSDQFGSAVAISAGVLAVGAPDHDEPFLLDAGAVYLFDIRTAALLGAFKKSTPATNDQFGPHWPCPEANSSSAPRSTILARPIQAQLIFSIWAPGLRRRLRPDADRLRKLRQRSRLSGGKALIGAPEQKISGVASGAAYLFGTATGTPLLRTFLNPTPTADDLFGHAVSLEGDAVAIGASLDDTIITNGGAVYLYNAITGALLQSLFDEARNRSGSINSARRWLCQEESFFRAPFSTARRHFQRSSLRLSGIATV